MKENTLFIADLHLHSEQEEIASIFLNFLRDDAINAEALYILGDLFVLWAGDDDKSEFHEKIKNALKKLTGSGTKVFIMVGNRDFLLGEKFAEESKTILLKDPTIIDLYGRKTLLTHGDRLCAPRDSMHTAFHEFMNKSSTLKLFFMFPIWLRRALAWGVHGFSCVRGLFISRKNLKEIVKKDALAAMLHHGVNQVIHGHIHIPFINENTINGINFRHIVLADWKDVGSVLVCKDNGRCDFIWLD